MRAGRWTAAASVAFSMACSNTGEGPMPSPSPSAQPVVATTITIANNTASPKDVIVARGSRVTIVNNDVISHDMHSDPHPEHTDCEELNQIGFLNPGESRESGNLNAAKVCSFHDHDLPSVAGLQGTVTIQ